MRCSAQVEDIGWGRTGVLALGATPGMLGRAVALTALQLGVIIGCTERTAGGGG